MPPIRRKKLTFDAKEFKGSRLRCLQLTSLNNDIVAEFLTELVKPHAQVVAESVWIPRGMLAPREAELGKAKEFLSDRQRTKAINWWLADPQPNTRIPNWDVVSNCTVKGRPGLVLVEAKSHLSELREGDSSKAKGENRKKIEDALAKADEKLNELISGWKLDAHSHYQLSNRFAWAWNVASMGVPVVLVYLGFLNAREMITDARQVFHSAKDWEDRVRNYSNGVVPSSMWNGVVWVNEQTPLHALIRAAEVTVKAKVVE